MTRSTAGLLAPLLAGCSLLYNPNNLPAPVIDAPDAPVDVPDIDARLPPDANEAMLVLTDITPTVINEGQGDGGSLPALFVIRGQNIVNANLKVELVPPSGVTVSLEPITGALASANNSYAVFAVTAHVDTALETDVALQVKVTQDISAQYGGGTVTKPGPLDPPLTVTLHGLPELTSVKLVAGKLATAIPAKLYSKVDLANVPSLGFTGTERAEILAVSSIRTSAVNADGLGTTPGPGGFAGGTSMGAGGGGGGLGGSITGLGLASGGGGGGAGYGADGGAGGAGSGLGAGTAGVRGARCGDDLILSFTTNRASAGGGGGAGNLTGAGAGGEGGAGGGTVVFDAGGDITATTVSAKGGDGVTKTGGGGGGGGGAGGTVLFSSVNGALAITSVTVAGGVLGMPNGGAGAAGRVRWDSPTSTAPGTSNGVVQRGPAFVVSEHVFTTAAPQMMVQGMPNAVFDVRVIDHGNTSHDGEHTSFNSSGVAMITPALSPGHNRVCVTLTGGQRGTIAERCIDVAYLP